MCFEKVGFPYIFAIFFVFSELQVNGKIYFYIRPNFDFLEIQKCKYVFGMSAMFGFVFNVFHMGLIFPTMHCLYGLTIDIMFDYQESTRLSIVF